MNSIEAKPIWQGRIRFYSIPFLVVAFIIIVLTGLSTNTLHNSLKSSISLKQNNNFDDAVENLIHSLTIDISNEYTSTYGHAGQQYPWIQFPVVEPYRATKIEVSYSDSTNSADLDDVEYIWLFDGVFLKKTKEQYIEYYFKDLNYYEITVKELSTSTGEINAIVTQKVVCRYVRREIRSLTDADREAFFDTAWIVYNTPLKKGKELYGENYNDITALISFHNSRAGDVNCDHLHDGYGFLTSHVAITLMFEKSLQAVNPMVSVPYWDYTIDGTAMVTSGNNDMSYWRDSIVFSEDWFGEAAPADKVVTSGRFSYVPVASNMFNKTSVHNAYGYLRAPWNQNNIPYVTRGDSVFGYSLSEVPTCESHANLLKVNNFGEFIKSSAYAPHGTVHIALGGVWGADWSKYFEEWGFDATSSKKWGLAGFAKQKNLYRMRVLQCPQYCSLDTPTEDCKCTCPHFDSYLQDKSQLSSVISTIFDNDNDIDESYHEGLLNLVCNKQDDLIPQTGDHLESASPADISFWPMHPTMDRIFQWKVLNGFESSNWNDNQAWSVHGTSTGYCFGHNLMDIIGFENLFEDFSGPYTNKDLLDKFNPNIDSTPYIYDSFSWDHCMDSGYSNTLF